MVAALKAEEDRKTALLADLEAVANVECVTSLDTVRLKDELRARVADVKDLLAQHTPQARQMLRKLLNGKLEMTPVEIDGRRGYRFTGTGTYERLLSGEALETIARTVVAPTGFEPVLQVSHALRGFQHDQPIERRPERRREPEQCPDRGILLAVLDAADVGAIEPSLVGELLLRPAPR